MRASSRAEWTSRSRTLVALGLAMFLLGIGIYAGLRSPWGAKHAQGKQGVAMRANTENDIVLFDADDGTQIAFDANGVWWHTEGMSGEGDPPCLRQPSVRVDVEVGTMWIAGPDGGAHEQAMWVRCP